MPAEIFQLRPLHSSPPPLLGERLPQVVVVGLDGQAYRLRDLGAPLLLELVDVRRAACVGADPVSEISVRHGVTHVTVLTGVGPTPPDVNRCDMARQVALHLLGTPVPPRLVTFDDAHSATSRSLHASGDALLVVGTDHRVIWRSDTCPTETLEEVLGTLWRPPLAPLREEVLETLQHRWSVAVRVLSSMRRLLRLR